MCAAGHYPFIFFPVFVFKQETIVFSPFFTKNADQNCAMIVVIIFSVLQNVHRERNNEILIRLG